MPEGSRREAGSTQEVATTQALSGKGQEESMKLGTSVCLDARVLIGQGDVREEGFVVSQLRAVRWIDSIYIWCRMRPAKL